MIKQNNIAFTCIQVNVQVIVVDSLVGLPVQGLSLA